VQFSKKENKVGIVFMKYIDDFGEKPYIFIGIFKYDGIEEVTKNGKKVRSKKYMRYSNIIELANFKNHYFSQDFEK
jgi:hypothetical protein